MIRTAIIEDQREIREGFGQLTLSEAKVLDASERVSRYIREQQEHFGPLGSPLKEDQRLAVSSFFSPDLLKQVRIVKVDAARAPDDPLLGEAKALGVNNGVELAHPSWQTFYDVIVFHGDLTQRALFHALVHMVQFDVLGLEQYAELFVRSFARTRSTLKVPLEAHAFSLEAGFAEGPAKPFSVEEKVRLWANQGRYTQV